MTNFYSYPKKDREYLLILLLIRVGVSLAGRTGWILGESFARTDRKIFVKEPRISIGEDAI